LKFLISFLLLTFSVTTFALRRPFLLEIDGQKIEDSNQMVFSWETKPIFNDFKEVRVNGQVLQPYILRKGQAIFIRADDGTGDYRMDYLRNGPERRAISCELKATAVPKDIKDIKVSAAALLKFGEAVLAYPLEDEYKVAGQRFNYYLCLPN
jgi:hypothetical protein